jgi:hypothetical protein
VPGGAVGGAAVDAVVAFDPVVLLPAERRMSISEGKVFTNLFYV